MSHRRAAAASTLEWTEMEGKTIPKHTKQVMDSAVAYYSQTNAQLVPKQLCCLSLADSPCCIVQCDATWYGISPGQLGSAGSVLSQLLVHPQSPRWQGGVRSWKVHELM